MRVGSIIVTKTEWNPILRDEFAKPYWAELQAFVADERANHAVYPPPDQVFAALHLTPVSKVRVVILGQDPYHGPGQAHGLSFSVEPPVPPPPSLRNIFKELADDVGVTDPGHGSLKAWAKQGVLLLNASLTVRAGSAGSHRGHGWEVFTDQVIRRVNEIPETVIFLLWGATARKKRDLIEAPHHIIIESPHPSPFSAHTGFFGSRPFSRANQALIEAGRAPIDWDLSE